MMDFTTTLLVLTVLLIQGVDSIAFSPYPKLVTVEYSFIFCIKSDRYEEGNLLVCAKNGVFKFNLTSKRSTPIAGHYDESGHSDGEGVDARFSLIADIIQINQKSLIVSDYGNNCLRWINNTQTSTLAGVCESHGLIDGPFNYARFHTPKGLLWHGMSLYVCDYFNHALRLLSLSTNTVSTILRQSSKISLEGFNSFSYIHYPTGLTCIYPECENIYITFAHGVTLFNRINNTSRLIAGGISTGASTGSLAGTQFHLPHGLLFLTKDILLVADFGNNRLVLLDLDQNYSRSVLTDLHNLHGEKMDLICYNNTLYIGTVNAGILMSELTEITYNDFICDQPEKQPIDPTSTTTTITTTVLPDSNQTVIITVGIAAAALVIIVVVISFTTCIIKLHRNSLLETPSPVIQQHTSTQPAEPALTTRHSRTLRTVPSKVSDADYYTRVNEREMLPVTTLDAWRSPDGYAEPTEETSNDSSAAQSSTVKRVVVPHNEGCTSYADISETDRAPPENHYDYPQLPADLLDAGLAAAALRAVDIPQEHCAADLRFSDREYVEILPDNVVEDPAPQTNGPKTIGPQL